MNDEHPSLGNDPDRQDDTRRGTALDKVISGELKYDPTSDGLIKEAISKTGFELGIVYLEDIVRKIEHEPGNLDRNTQLYAVGELLRQHCDNKLKQAEAEVERIIRDSDGQPVSTESLMPD